MRQTIIESLDNGNIDKVADLAATILENGDENMGGKMPSIHYYVGVALYRRNLLEQAATSFAKAIQTYDNDLASWLALGDSYLCRFQIARACWAYENAIVIRNLTTDVSKLYKGRSWMADWTNRDEMSCQIRKMVREKKHLTISPADFFELSSDLILKSSKHLLYAQPVSQQVTIQPSNSAKPLRIGFISSDFGIHPVATLIRGLLTSFNATSFEIYCFAMTKEDSWWKHNITKSVAQMVELAGINGYEAAKIVAGYGIHILIDLNGHTLNTGMQILSFRPAPVQLSFLGYPLTTGAPFIDYFVVDKVTVPPVMEKHFSEKLLYIPTTYMVNDHLQIMGHTIDWDRPSSSTPDTPVRRDQDTIVFACFSNWQKIDPVIFTAWMQILHAVPNSILWFLRYKGHEDAEKNLRRTAAAHGIVPSQRLVFTNQVAWLNHTWIKRSADIVLDTSLKNGHTTILDALWAGIPVVSLEGDKMLNRVASSLLETMDVSELVTRSIREYTNVAIQIAQDRNLRLYLQGKIQEKRLISPLFDVKQWTWRFQGLLQSIWEQHASNRSIGHSFSHYKPTQDSVLAAESLTELDAYRWMISSTLEVNKPILLHIGGVAYREDWWIINVLPGDHVAMRLNMMDLAVFPNNSVTAIYASHVLEHVHYGVTQEVHQVLREWHRVLKHGGALFVSVPDLDVLNKLYLESQTATERFDIMRIMYGGQVDEYDVHKVGFNQEILAAFLQECGFCNIRRKEVFNLFEDTNKAKLRDVYISLNLIATACEKPGDPITVELRV